MPFQKRWGERTDQSESATFPPHPLSQTIDMAFGDFHLSTVLQIGVLYTVQTNVYMPCITTPGLRWLLQILFIQKKSESEYAVKHVHWISEEQSKNREYHHSPESTSQDAKPRV
jgi:hypothetical protein